jgi:Reverse transcriptase (RNA-dependent DNA polymerase)
MFSKAIPRKPIGFEIRESENQSWKAPIPLFPEPDSGNTETEMVKVKLRRYPTVASSATYEKSYTPWAGHTVEGYCKFRAMLDEYIKQAPLRNINERVPAVSYLLSGTPLSNWQNVLEQLPDGHVWNEESFQEALRVFALNYCSSTARQEQKRFMKRHLGLPGGHTTTTLLSRIQQFNRYLQYLPGTGNKFDSDDIREMVYNSLPNYIHTIISTTDYKWDEENKSDAEVCSYFDRLLVISALARGDEKSNKPPSNKPNTYTSKKNSFKKHSFKKEPSSHGKNKKVQCDFCNMKGHSEDDCRFKLKARKELQHRKKQKTQQISKTNAQENFMVEHEMSDLSVASNNLNEMPEMQEFLRNMETEVCNHFVILNKIETKSNTTDTAVSRLELAVKIKSSSFDELVFKNVLLDTGCTKTIVKANRLPKQYLEDNRKPNEKVWNTNSGSFVTKFDVELTFSFIDFAPSKEIKWLVAVDETDNSTRYDMIVGRDLQHAMGMDILFSTKTLRWDGIEIPMRTAKSNLIDSHIINRNYNKYIDIFAIASSTMKILDAKYERANLDAYLNLLSHLDSKQKFDLKSLLLKYEPLFDGSLGNWKTDPVHLHLKKGEMPFHLPPFPVPKFHEETLKKEIKRLCELGVLQPQVASEYQSPSFIIPKKNGTVRVVSDFRILNSKLQRVTYPIPKIQDILISLNGFTYATSIDLNMGYYTLALTPEAQKLCTIVFPWGKYSYLRLPMGIANAPDIFQSKINQLMEGLDYVRAYLDDILIVTKNTFEDHLNKLETVLQRLHTADLKINIEKSTFATTSFEYLGYHITTSGIRPLTSKVEAIQRLKPPKTLKQLRSLLGLINYYRDMWKRRSHILSPLTE